VLKSVETTVCTSVASVSPFFASVNHLSRDQTRAKESLLWWTLFRARHHTHACSRTMRSHACAYSSVICRSCISLAGLRLVSAGGLGGLVCSHFCCVWLLLLSVSVGVCSSAASSASAVFFVGLCCWVGSLSVPFGFLLAFLPLPPFPLSHLCITYAVSLEVHASAPLASCACQLNGIARLVKSLCRRVGPC
jgi:hypothetical protein